MTYIAFEKFHWTHWWCHTCKPQHLCKRLHTHEQTHTHTHKYAHAHTHTYAYPPTHPPTHQPTHPPTYIPATLLLPAVPASVCSASLPDICPDIIATNSSNSIVPLWCTHMSTQTCQKRPKRKDLYTSKSTSK